MICCVCGFNYSRGVKFKDGFVCERDVWNMGLLFPFVVVGGNGLRFNPAKTLDHFIGMGD